MILNKEKLDKYLNQYVGILKNIFKNELLKVVLFGSYSRNEATEDSDIDVMIVINGGDDNIYKYHDKLMKDTAYFNLDNDIDIQLITLSKTYYNDWRFTHRLLKTVDKEGITYYEQRKC